MSYLNLLFPFFLEKYLDNKNATQSAMMPPKKKKTMPKKKAPPPEPDLEEAEEVDNVEDDDVEDEDDNDGVDEITHGVQDRLALNSWFNIDREQDFAILAYVWTAPLTMIWYILIRIKFTGSIVGSMVKADFAKQGHAVECKVKYLKGGERTNPDHLVPMYGPGVRQHPLYAQLQMINWMVNEARETVTWTLHIKLPFHCNPAKFFDPLCPDDTAYEFGTFPLDQPLEMQDPLPTTKFLHLSCIELYTPKFTQVVKTTNYASPA